VMASGKAVRGATLTFVSRLLFTLAAGAALAAWPGAAGAADGEVSARSSGTLTQETLGVELIPASMALGQPPDATESRFDVGAGGSLRLFRHRWERVYVTPIQAGLFVSSVSESAVVHLQTEAGVIVPRTARRLELGLGVGVGGAFIDHEDNCNQPFCSSRSGSGWMTSLVARYLFADRPGMTAGIGMRAIVFPLHGVDWFSRGVVLVAFDFAFGLVAPPAQPTSTQPERPSLD
jgi:hypothetical protein